MSPPHTHTHIHVCTYICTQVHTQAHTHKCTQMCQIGTQVAKVEALQPWRIEEIKHKECLDYGHKKYRQVGKAIRGKATAARPTLAIVYTFRLVEFPRHLVNNPTTADQSMSSRLASLYSELRKEVPPWLLLGILYKLFTQHTNRLWGADS